MLGRHFFEAAQNFKAEAKVGLSNTTAVAAKEYICQKIPADIWELGLERRVYKIKGTVGQGRTVEVPWIAVMNKSITTSTTRGIYVVYLISSDMKQVFLSLMMGCAFFDGTGTGKRTRIQTIAREISNQIVYSSRFTNGVIDLKAKSDTAKGYEVASIISKKYSLENMPADSVLKDDLFELLNVYDSLTSIIGKRTVEDFYAYILADMEGLLVESVNSNNFKSRSRRVGKTVDQPEKKVDSVTDNKGKKHYPRNAQKAGDALLSAGFMCEVDAGHFSFYSKVDPSRMYVEAHHLIPLSKYDEFENSLDIPANIVSLCPNCHRCIHHATSNESERLLQVLYNKRKQRLIDAGIGIQSFDVFLEKSQL